MTIFSKILTVVITSICIILLMLMCVLSFKNFKNDPLYIHAEFESLFNEFRADADKFNVTPRFSGLTTTFVDDIENGILGYCIPKFNTVKISKFKWNRLDEISKKLLVYHEWAHCTLRREHTEDTGNFCPTSIMHPYINPTTSCYSSFKEWYDLELFTNPNKTRLIHEETYETSSFFSTTNH